MTLIFTAKVLRLMGYGITTAMFFVYLFLKDIPEEHINLIQNFIIFGDILISLYLTTQADKIGRINTLMLAALLKFITGIIYAESSNTFILAFSGALESHHL